MSALLDTHFLLWIVYESPKLRRYRWIERYLPWSISPVTFMEIRYLVESGSLRTDVDRLVESLSEDDRFLLDEPALSAVIRHAVGIGWTRDVFDRLLSAHSLARNLHFCSVDRLVQEHHPLLVRELRS